jgi:hypothetical protein
MSIANTIFWNDKTRLENQGVPQIGARVSTDPSVLAEDKFMREHGGMSYAAYRERDQLIAREAFEQEATADLEGDPPPCDVPASLTPKRAMYARYHAWLSAEQAKLAALERKRTELQAIVDLPLATESDIRAMLRRTADALLNGVPADESDAAKRLELEGRRIDQLHKCEAAKIALNHLGQQITVSELRVARLREREREFLYPILHEAAEPLERLLDRKRAEVAALEKTLFPIWNDFATYQVVENIDPPDVSVKSRHSWYDIADALQADPAADISKMIPAPKF